VGIVRRIDDKDCNNHLAVAEGCQDFLGNGGVFAKVVTEDLQQLLPLLELGVEVEDKKEVGVEVVEGRVGVVVATWMVDDEDEVKEDHMEEEGADEDDVAWVQFQGEWGVPNSIHCCRIEKVGAEERRNSLDETGIAVITGLAVVRWVEQQQWEEVGQAR